MELNNSTVEGFLKDWFEVNSYKWEGKVLIKKEDYKKLCEELYSLFKIYGS